jgi:pimeloyl-ACP methyl ester carboxylesterase
MHRLGWTLSVLGLLIPSALPQPGNLVTYRVVPHTTDSAIERFDEPHYVVFNRDGSSPATLLVFMSGTGGQPAAMSDFLTIAAEQGYRVVSLAYNDQPAVVGICPRDPNPACSAEVRQRRIFGDPVTRRIDDTPAESIVNRLAKLLTTLDREHPAEKWDQYLDGGAPRWERIAVAGHSQGAGMAAFIAQRQRVARVILFSSPWDFFGRRQLAPWILAGPGVTPPDAWFAAYHKKENTADLLAESYKALRIPREHIRVFTLEPSRVVGPNPYHLSMVGNGATPRDKGGTPLYADEWRFLLSTLR